MSQPQQEVRIPTRQELEAQLTGLVVTRSQMKDQVEAIERDMAIVSGQVQLLGAQEAKAKADAEAIED